MISKVIPDGSILLFECDGVIGPRKCSKTQVHMGETEEEALEIATRRKWEVGLLGLCFCPKCSRPVVWGNGAEHG